jgi:hypothetical protein
MSTDFVSEGAVEIKGMDLGPVFNHCANMVLPELGFSNGMAATGPLIDTRSRTNVHPEMTQGYFENGTYGEISIQANGNTGLTIEASAAGSEPVHVYAPHGLEGGMTADAGYDPASLQGEMLKTAVKGMQECVRATKVSFKP